MSGYSTDSVLINQLLVDRMPSGETVGYLSFIGEERNCLSRLFVITFFFIPQLMLACPFCAKFTRSYSDEVRDADAVAFGVLDRAKNGMNQTKFTITIVVRSGGTLSTNSSVLLAQSVSGAEQQPITRLVFLRKDGDKWKAARIDKSSMPFAEYLKNAWKLFDEPASQRMAFFFKHLNDPDEKISADAYVEFSKASFRSTVAGAKSYDPVLLREWLTDPNTPGDRIGLLGLLLGLSGGERDADFLDRLIGHPSLTQRNGLDGLIGGLLLLDRPRGEMRIIERLSAKDATSLERMSAVSALRFLLSDLPPQDSTALLRQTIPSLQNSEVAGQLIDEMRKASFWEALPEVLKLYPGSREPSAIIRFAIESPRPEAKAFISELNTINPALVRDAEQTLLFERHSRDAQRDLRMK
ncbi:hypothetical protein K2Y11_13100 [bacterium]|nr:hypothetical protein [bacterium]